MNPLNKYSHNVNDSIVVTTNLSSLVQKSKRALAQRRQVDFHVPEVVAIALFLRVGRRIIVRSRPVDK